MSRLEIYPIKFRLDSFGDADGELYRIKAPHSVENIWYALPLSGRVRIQDDAQAYFLIDIQVKAEHPTFEIEVGDIAYWPMSKAICIFFSKIRPYSEVNIIGKVTYNLEAFRKVKNFTRIQMEKR